MGIGVGVYLASYLQNRSERFSEKRPLSLSQQKWIATHQLQKNELLNMTVTSEETHPSVWKNIYDSFSDGLHESEENSFFSENNSNFANNKTEIGRNSTSKNFLTSNAGKRALIHGLKSDRFLMLSKLNHHPVDDPRQIISSESLDLSLNEDGNSVSKSAKEWMDLFEQAQGNAEFMSYASDNFEYGSSNRKKSQIPIAYSDVLVKGKYDAYKFFSVSNVEKMMKNNYRPEEAVRILDMAL